jgi:hypothetical protein
MAVPVRRSRTSRGPADKLGGGGNGTSRAGTSVAPQSDESRGIGANHDEDRVGEVPVVGKGRAAQKAIEKVGNGHFAREEVGADETG